MACNGPIDDYLNDLYQRVAGWHRRPGDVVSEAADHLGERVEALTADGYGIEKATARAIADYGSPGEIADAHLRAARRPAIPTTATRTSGVFAMFGGVAWIGLVLLVAVLPDDNTFAWLAMANVFHLAVAMSIVAMFGLWQRHGGLGPMTLLALIPTVLASPFVLFVWPIPAWTMLLGSASLLFGIPVIRRRLAPLASSVALTAGLTAAGLAVLGAELFVSRTGEDFAFLESGPATLAVALGLVTFGLGLIGLGRWMRGEVPVEIPPLPAPTMSGAAPA